MLRLDTKAGTRYCGAVSGPGAGHRAAQTENLSIYDISAALKAQGRPLSPAAVALKIVAGFFRAPTCRYATV